MTTNSNNLYENICACVRFFSADYHYEVLYSPDGDTKKEGAALLDKLGVPIVDGKAIKDVTDSPAVGAVAAATMAHSAAAGQAGDDNGAAS